MPSAKGLFHRAIIESGPTIKLVAIGPANHAADRLLTKLGIDRGNVAKIQDCRLKESWRRTSPL